MDRWSRRTIVAGLVAAAFALTGTVPVRAQAPPPAVEVSADDGGVEITRRCDGSEEVAPLAMVFYLIHDGDPAEAPVVNVSWSGSLAVDGGTQLYDGTVGDLPDQFTFDPSIESLEFGLFPTRAGELTLTIEPGSGYQVATQGAATADVPSTIITPACPAPTTTAAPGPQVGGGTAPAAAPIATQPTFTG